MLSEVKTKPITALKPMVGWFGGKSRQAPQIVERIRQIPHLTYAEPFFGMGSVFWARGEDWLYGGNGKKTMRNRHTEIINDANRDVTNLFRVVKHHPDALVNELRWALIARDDFNRMVKTNPDNLTDIQRAARFYFIMRLCYGGRVRSPSYGSSAKLSKNIDGANLRSRIETYHQRLRRVNIECLDWRAFLDKFDRPETLFYLDPPYWDHETDYGKGMFTPNCHAELADRLRNLSGHWLLSYNDTPEIRSLYQDWAKIEELKCTYSIQKPQSAIELVISRKG